MWWGGMLENPPIRRKGAGRQISRCLRLHLLIGGPAWQHGEGGVAWCQQRNNDSDGRERQSRAARPEGGRNTAQAQQRHGVQPASRRDVAGPLCPALYETGGLPLVMEALLLPCLTDGEGVAACQGLQGVWLHYS